jgi:PBSX family phage terminase large subunit
VVFKKTAKQEEATQLMASSAKHIAMLGGSRSGKTFIIVRNILIRAAKVKSRHVSLRQTFNSAKVSIFLDTLPKVLDLCFKDMPIQWNKSDHYITLPNGSEYWIGGLDDDKRVEKILGREFSTIHFNEITQMNYKSVQLALSRLAEKNILSKKALYDFNPNLRSHWSYGQFIKKINPVDNEPIINPSDYAWIKMNPSDNLANIDDDYLQLLQSLPERERTRFLNGDFTDDSDGQAYYAFNQDQHIKPVSKQCGTIFVGMDFNVNPMTAVVGQMLEGKFHIVDEIYLENSDTHKMCIELMKRGYVGARVIPDSTGRNRKTSGSSDFDILKQNGFQIDWSLNPYVHDRVNAVNQALGKGQIVIDPKCRKLIGDLESVVWKNNELDKKSDAMLTHISDALGYAIYKLIFMHREQNLDISGY